MQNAKPKATSPEPPFKRCPRCQYALRGLPSNHACPECGLAYDEDCEWHRATRPTQVLVVWTFIIAGGFSVLQNIPDLFRFDSISVLKKVMALVALAWCIIVPIAIGWLVKRHRAGFGVVVAGDGLLINLPALTDKLVPWENVTRASIYQDGKDVVLIKRRSEESIHIAVIHLMGQGRNLQIGRTGGVFPTRADVERFVEQVNTRVAAGTDSEEG